MVFMIKLPPASSMAPPAYSNRKDDKMSLLKTIHRPYGQLDGVIDTRNIAVQHRSECQSSRYGQYQNQELNNQHVSEKEQSCSTSKQRMIVVSTLIVSACLVVFVVTVTSYGKVPIEEVDSTRISDVLDDLSNLVSEVSVKTNCGRIVGVPDGEGYAFKGIPYAKSPVGALRWRKPVPLWIEEEWCKQNQVHRATEFGSPCFQLNPYSKQFEGKEDCLYLNVWTPKLESTNTENSGGMEVLVYIHGGFLQFGNGNVDGLSPSGDLARKLGVVFVSLNYRLYTLGFMAMDILVDNVLMDSKGNYGIWDQLCALQWVKDNIKSFGGDPRKVTLFGPDSGAASIMALMSSTKSQGLFRSAWLIGPTMILNRAFVDVSAHNKALFLQRSACKDAQCLRKATPEDILTAHLGKDDASFRIRDQNDLPIQGIFPEQLIIIDGDLLKQNPPDVFKDKQMKTVPIMLGTAAQAVDFWPGPEDLPSWTWSQYKKYVTTSLDSFGPQVSKMALSIYNATASQILNPDSTAEYLYTSMVSDIRQTCPMNELSKRLAEFSRTPVYRYSLKATPSSAAKIFNYEAKYAFHLWDLIAFFDKMEHFIDIPSEEDNVFRDLMHKTIMTFIRTGGQSVGDEEWLRYPKKSAELRHNITFEDITKKECKFWSQSGLSVYVWVS